VIHAAGSYTCPTSPHDIRTRRLAGIRPAVSPRLRAPGGDSHAPPAQDRSRAARTAPVTVTGIPLRRDGAGGKAHFLWPVAQAPGRPLRALRGRERPTEPYQTRAGGANEVGVSRARSGGADNGSFPRPSASAFPSCAVRWECVSRGGSPEAVPRVTRPRARACGS